MEKKQRYTCTCDFERARAEKDTYTYTRQTVLDLPQWSKAYKNRLMNNYPPNVSIDSCIVEAIKQLWDRGIETTGSCCGHNLENAWVSVDPEDYPAMYELGYEQRPVIISGEGHAMGLYTFYL